MSAAALPGVIGSARVVADMPLPWKTAEVKPKPPPLILGLDLGQSMDPSACCIAEKAKAPDPDDESRLVSHYSIRYIRRWPLGTNYTGVVAGVGKMVAEPPLTGCHLVADASGCGRPVVDFIRKERLPVANVAGVVITPGHSETFDAKAGLYHVSKVILISMLLVMLGRRRLKFAAGLPETATLVKELQAYRVTVTPAANEAFSAREGAHDDMLLALALAVWYGERQMKTLVIG